MPKKTGSIQIRQTPEEVAGFVREAQANADTNRDALGFLPSQAYEQAASQGTLFIALQVTGDGGERYAGHILFGASYPHARIYQLFVAPASRANGIGRMLIESLVEFTEAKQYLSVIAKVADDLSANGFYKALGFETLRTKAGGASRGRTINIRVRQLNTPALFGYRWPVSGLPLAELPPRSTPVFVIDLNVFFDVAKKRPRAEFGGAVMSAAFNNIVRLLVTDEFAKELRRSATASTDDPVLEFAMQLPTLPAPANGLDQAILNELANIVFPGKASTGKMTAQDTSDLAHLAIAAHHKVAGFVTAEDALVNASPAIEGRFGVRVTHVRDLAGLLKSAMETPSPLEIGFADMDLRLSAVDDSHARGVARLAESVKLPDELRTLAVTEGIQASTRCSLAVSLGSEVVCAALWQPQSALQGALEAIVLADEDQASIEVAVDALLCQLSQIASAHSPTRIQLLIPNAYLSTQRLALRFGFTRSPGKWPELSRFERLSIGRTVSASSWPKVRRALQSASDMLLPQTLPAMTSDDVRIPFESKEGKQFAIDLFDLETALAPTMFILEGRAGVLAPIRAAFADHLLGTATQISLLPLRQASALHDRTYFSAARNLALMRRGTPVVFYESGKANGRCAAIAIARVRSTVVVPKRKIAASLIETGVLDEDEVAEITTRDEVAATTVDNVMKLTKPVGLNRLRELGCIDGSNAVTSRAISASQLQQIIIEGQGEHE